jgi:hypothetical protein
VAAFLCRWFTLAGFQLGKEALLEQHKNEGRQADSQQSEVEHYH